MLPEQVALLAEGVDRNYSGRNAEVVRQRSPSSRRAWIEIAQKVESFCPMRVALLAEGVDRNNINLTEKEQAARRPPRGGRG